MMTALEMQKNFQIRSRRQSNPVDSEDIFYFLNQAQLQLVREKFEKRTPRDPSHFEANQAITDELKTLVTEPTEIDAYYAGDNSMVADFKADRIDFEDDHMYLLNHRSKILIPDSGAVVGLNGADPDKRVISSGSSTTKYISNRLSQVDDIYKLLDDPFNTTRSNDPLAEVSNNGLTVYTKGDEFIIDTVRIVYLRKPKDIVYSSGSSQSSELPEFMHEDIVDLAVALFNGPGKSAITETETAN